MTKSMTSVAGLAGIDPRVAVFAIGAACIVALASMTLGYNVELGVLDTNVRLSKPGSTAPQLC